MSRDDLRHGALYMVAAALLFAGVGACVRILSASLPNEMVVFFRSFFGLVALLPLAWHRGVGSLKTRRLGGHLARGLAGVAAMYCYFYAVAQMPLAEAVLLNYTTPLFVPFIAALWLHERVPPKLWAAIGTGFLGILFILKPGQDLFTPVALIGLASGMLAAFAMTGVRRLTHTEPVFRIVFYFSLVSTVIAAVPLPVRWQTPDASLWLLLIVMGVIASLGQLLLTRAYACAPAAQVGPFSYATVVFAAVAGWVLWGEVLDAFSFIGAALVCLGGALTIRHAGAVAAPVPELPESSK
ncbi:MAG: DMT family transporter [Gammaproteobacteria bacterium]|nr:DMT family transporter [Gammaproteobacteria bacterium]